jgi:hypothetical protein
MALMAWLWLGLVGFFAVFLTVVFRDEKRMVWPYAELENAPFLEIPPATAIAG